MASNSPNASCNESHRFLALLDPNTSHWHFRTFPDIGKSDGRKYDGALDEVMTSLQLDNASGRGVFVVVNEGGAKDSEIGRVRAVYADFDGTPLPGSFGDFEPHLIIQTSAGRFHVYWLVDGLAVSDFKALQKAIAARYGSDPSVCNPSRLMRLPGFLHCKPADSEGHNGEPFRSKIIHESGGLPYVAERVQAEFRTQECGSQTLPCQAAMPSAPGFMFSPEGAAGVVVDTGRHDDLLKVSARFARMMHFEGLSQDATLAAMKSERDRGRWTRFVPDDEIERALEGALEKCRNGEWNDASTPTAPSPAWANKPNRRTMKFRRADELIANPTPLSWLIRGVLELDSFCLIFGDPGVGKSFLALDIAPSVATGTAWQGHAVTPGPVFYIAGEGGNGLGRRLRAWEIGRGVSLAGAPLHVSTMPASLTDEQSAAEAVEVVNQMSAQHGAPKLIVLDTVARNFGPGDENSTKDMTAFVAACDVLRERTGACVLLVHHSGHGDKTRARGSMALKGALDWEYAMVQRHGAIVVHCTKAKDAEPPDPKAFRLVSVDLGTIDEDGEAVTSALLQPADFMPPLKKGKAGRGKNQTLALDQLKRGIKERDEHFCAIDEDDEPWMGLTAWRDRCAAAGLDIKRFSEAKKSLSTQGFVRIEGERVTIQDPEFHVI